MKRLRDRYLQPIVLVLLAIYFFGSSIPEAWKKLNTDFPNYYLTARMAREHTDTSRAYEWMWIEREKDHRGLDQRIVGLVPITPFSTLIVWPLATAAPLTAKHIWIVLNLALLAAIVWMLAGVSRLSVIQTAILIGLSYPLQFNFMLGQYYVLLLALLVGGCWATQRRRHWTAGVLVGLAAAIKIFPIILILHFARKRNWKALGACLGTVAASVLFSISVLGVGMHRTYLLQVLPATLRGDGLPPFHLGSSSLSTVLHRLFLFEPQWNPHPAIQAAWMFAVLHPVLQLMLLAPAVLLIRTRESSPLRTALEWSGLLMVSLTISTSPGFYLYTEALLPVAILCKCFLRTRRYGLLRGTLLLLLAVGVPDWHIAPREGWGTLLCVPRLYALIALTLLVFAVLRRRAPVAASSTQRLWVGALAVGTLFSIFSGLRHERRLFDDDQYRLPMSDSLLLASHPQAFGTGNAVFVGLSMEGYRVGSIATLPAATIVKPENPLVDQLSFAVTGKNIRTEDALPQSNVTSTDPQVPSLRNAESPIVSPDGDVIAFLRLIGCHRQLFVCRAGEPEKQLTAAPFDIYEAAFVTHDELIVAAANRGNAPALYRLSGDGAMTPLAGGVARYPAVSPDGQWLAFSKFDAGSWNLYLRELATGRLARVSSVPCNQIEAAWQADSKTLLYASDCGRALWFTAIARRQVLPLPEVAKR